MKKKRLLGIFSVLIFTFAGFIEWLMIYNLDQYELGFLNVYADEQDGYVEITLDQIDRLGENASEDKITEIIASLDANASKYWTLSTGDNILFIKSITETNRYKNYTSNSYYDTESAKEYLNSLTENKVVHGIIMLDGDRYVISGGLFNWNGSSYRICLLTYDKAILSQNDILEAKNAIILITTVVLTLFICFVVYLTRILDRKNATISEAKEYQVTLNRHIDMLEDSIKRENAYSASKHAFSIGTVFEFLEKIDNKEIRPVVLVYLKVDDAKNLENVLMSFRMMLDNNVIRFIVNETDILLLMGANTTDFHSAILDSVREVEHVNVASSVTFADNKTPYIEQFKTYWEEEGYEPVKPL